MLNIENVISEGLSKGQFSELSLEIFRQQFQKNQLYRAWVESLKVDLKSIDSPEKIPFLPIEFFKSKTVICQPLNKNTQVFLSSSTSSQVPAKHFVNDIRWYERSFKLGFEMFYGSPSDYCILALLPSYLQRTGSSLVYMCQKLIEAGNHQLSGFFLHDHGELIKRIEQLNQSGQKTILIGVSYALMDLCDHGVKLGKNFIVMETGGMKGVRKELHKKELHDYLIRGFSCKKIHSEYGMTELLSQSYSSGDGVFEYPPWLRFFIREVEDPLKIRMDHKTGGINVIDLANINSCSFIATKDLGWLNEKGQLQLMGRYDHSDVRGCNLMLTNN